MNSWEAFYGPNVGYALELYERYLQDPRSVDPETRAFFDQAGQLGDLPSAVATLARPATRTLTEGNGQRAMGNGPRSLDPAALTATGPAEVEVRPTAQGPTPTAQSQTQRVPPTAHGPLGAEAVAPTKDEVGRVVAAARLARAIREYGHLDADIDPLGKDRRPGDPMLDPRTHGITDEELARLPASIVWPSARQEDGTCLDAIGRLRAIYSGPIGYDFDHVQDFDERAWLHAVVENGSFRTPLPAEQKRALLKTLTEVDTFERFLHTVFQGQKRFSIEGNDTLVPILDQIIGDAGETGIREVLIGMAHRGRLSVLMHTLRKPYEAIFAEFHTTAQKRTTALDEDDYIARTGGGDVKYHRGARREVRGGDPSGSRGSAPPAGAGVQVTLADNPSHLEFVQPVIQGSTRAAQDERDRPGEPSQDVDRALAITIHGDAAFPGEGVVAETLNLSALRGYRTGGTLHIIVNNQVGFTTSADAGRSTLYASDLAKGFEIPIVHVNADDPEACLSAVRLAYAYRNRFHKDFLVDLVGYRRWGHNESDEPAFTQPRLYSQISNHPRVRQLYAERLVAESVVTAEEAEEMVQRVQERLRQAREHEGTPGSDSQPGRATYSPRPQGSPASDEEPAPGESEEPRTAVPEEELRALNEAMLARPSDFTPNSKLERVLARRREAIDRPGGIDWAAAEALAFGSILADGTPIRLSGQDTERGTFSQRHLVLHDPETGKEFTPLQAIPQARASFAVYNSPLTETAVMAFEYGYSVHAPETLVVWEAQYGDFANVGQVVIDQFLTAARAKWQQEPALVMLLPHGYEGQGPEHSSARLERYLQMAAGDNIRIANPTTAAQYFHLLRLQAASLGSRQQSELGRPGGYPGAELRGKEQAATLDSERRPLIVMTPKSLLRKVEAGSSLADLAEGQFRPVLEDPSAVDRRDRIERLVLCSGKVAIDLETTAKSQPVERIAVARVELLYPFPRRSLERIIGAYPNLREAIWVQEEPANMGAWTFIAPRLRKVFPDNVPLRYVGRPERASTAAGSPDVHEWEQEQIIHEAYSGELAPNIETQGDADVD